MESTKIESPTQPSEKTGKLNGWVVFVVGMSLLLGVPAFFTWKVERDTNRQSPELTKMAEPILAEMRKNGWESLQCTGGINRTCWLKPDKNSEELYLRSADLEKPIFLFLGSQMAGWSTFDPYFTFTQSTVTLKSLKPLKDISPEWIESDFEYLAPKLPALHKEAVYREKQSEGMDERIKKEWNARK